MAERTAQQRHYQFPVRIFKEGAYWYADCPDLSLITRDRTQRGAMEALSIQALLYIESRVAAVAYA